MRPPCLSSPQSWWTAQRGGIERRTEMRIAKVVLGLVLCATSLSAQAAQRPAARRGAVPSGVETQAPCAKAALESQAVFLRLNDLPGLKTASTLELEIERNGKPLVAERFRLGTVKEGDLEILSRQPELLARVHKA